MTIINGDSQFKPSIRRPIVHDHGIMPGGCIPPGQPPIIKLDPDRFEFGKRDKDRDGTLSREEFGKSKLSSREFANYDLDKDGKLSYTEFNNGRDFDRLNDGNLLTADDHLTSEEYGPGLTKQLEFFRHDTDHDGKVTREEFAEGRARQLRPFPFPQPLPFPERPRPWPVPVEPPVIKLENLVEKAKLAQEKQP